MTGGTYQLYYLHSEQNNGDGGWDHATTLDCVSFTNQPTALPLEPNFPVWTGSSVVDINNTAGYGANAVIALATRPTDGVRKYQEQYLWWSIDDGYTFIARPDPVIVNTDGRTATTPEEIANAEWFRDPKVYWDSSNEQWICAIGRQRYASFYTSTNLIDWTWVSNFDYPNHDLGGIECPDLFEMTASDGTSHWVFGASMDAYSIDLPMTYAYWMGTWTGTQFVATDLTPQWLDWGWDWYAAVTWPKADAPQTRRLAIAWMNNWKYANRDVPTDISDGYNGQNSIVRELRLEQQSSGVYSLLSAPIDALQNYVTATTDIPTQVVDGSIILSWNGSAYEVELDISWDQATDVGVSVGRSSDGTRHTDVGKSGSELYVDRGPSDLAGYTLVPYTRAAAPIDADTRTVHLRVFVDTQSVEVFVDDGHIVLSQQVQFTDGDTGIALYSDGGPATFSNITIREFGTPI